MIILILMSIVNFKYRICFFLIITLTWLNPGYSNKTVTTFYYYHGRNYGSEAIYNPVIIIMNGGFGILQISNRSNRIADINFANGWKNVTYNLSHPFNT